MRVWLSGRALASQAEGRGFDPRHPLTKKGTSLTRVPFLERVTALPRYPIPKSLPSGKGLTGLL